MTAYQTRVCIIWLLLVLFSLAACSEEPDPLVLPPDQRHYDTAQLLRGEQLYNQNCASCHGPGGKGDPNWRKRGDDGRFPPPPLNGTAHTWHHPLAQLQHTISNGGPPGQSNMPAWKDTLSESQINDIIVWFQSLWGDEIYQAWYATQQRATQN